MKRISLTRLLSLVALLLALAVSSWTQAPPPSLPQKEDKDHAPATATVETRISPEEAKELFSSVDEILKFSSGDTDLPIKSEVKRELASRDTVEKYVSSHMNDEDAKRLERSEVVLKKFGLIPASFNLHNFLIDLLREQVAGYYDPKTKTVYLLEWVAPEQQKSVLAHELTHALQDQNFGLDHFLKNDEHDKNKVRPLSPADVVDDEEIVARQAVVEGQAMVSLLDYLLAPAGQSVLESPVLVESLERSMMSGNGSPIFQHAPLYLKESLTFPYRYGLDFTRAVMVHRGKEGAFAGVLKDPPRDSREVMEPSVYLEGKHVTPLLPPDLKPLLGASYEQYDLGAVGEFDTSILLKQYAGPDDARQLWPQWRGAYYYAATKKDKKDDVALLYLSRWGNEDAAQRMAEAYSSSLSNRYKSAKIARCEGCKSLPSGKNEKWNTEDGPVFIEPRGEYVLVMEGFDDATAAKLRKATMPASQKEAAAK